MKEKPIIFNSEMVRAVLEDRKSQTRRTKGLEIINEYPNSWEKVTCDHGSYLFQHKETHSAPWMKCPYGQPGDLLWVRETFCLAWNDPDHVFYKADGHEVNYHSPDGVLVAGKSPWKPSIHMSRLNSRITLAIVSVRVERVQAISLEDIASEGIRCKVPICGGGKQLFVKLWDSINKTRGYGWKKNPWVWAIKFRRVE